MYSDITEVLKRYGAKGSKFGLSRTRALLGAFGNPDRKMKIVHIAGSNGKGSIAAYIAAILKEAGEKVGSFTSPEVYSYFDKFKINETPADEKKLRAVLSETYDKAQTFSDKPTAFEIETVAAFVLFASEGCTYAVVECGLGGRDDATNAINKKEVAVFGSVSLEHTAILGSTVREICEVKAGIIKNCPAVFSALQEKEGREYFLSVGATPAGDGLKVIKEDEEGQTFLYKGKEYRISMHGAAQCYNAATAIEAALLLGVEQPVTERAISSVRLAGRCERIVKGGVTFVLDGAHNPAAFSPLCDLLRITSGDKSLAFGCLSDKDVESAAEILSPYFKEIAVFQPESYRAMDIERIYSAFSGKVNTIKKVGSVVGALEILNAKTVVVCGSFTILREAKSWIEKRQ